MCVYFAASATSAKHKGSAIGKANLPPGSASPGSETTIGDFLLDLVEDEQQLLVALFYWRRKMIESHFSAWKWAVFAFQSNATRQHGSAKTQDHDRSERSSRSVRQSLPRGVRRCSFIEPRVAHPPPIESAQVREKDQTVANKELVSSLKRQYRILKREDDSVTTEEQPKRSTIREASSLDSPHKSGSSDALLEQQRRDFRESLHLVFRAFALWRKAVDELQAKRSRVAVQTVQARAKRFAQTLFRAWKTFVLRCRYERKSVRQAELLDVKQTEQRHLRHWQLRARIHAEVRRRCLIQSKLLCRSTFRCWRHHAQLRRRSEAFCKRRMWRLTQHAVVTLHQFTARKLNERVLNEAAQVLWRRRTRRRFLTAWKEQVLSLPVYQLSKRASRKIAISSAIRKWRRFLAARQDSAHHKLQADFFRGVSCAQFCLQRWLQYHARKKKQTAILTRADLYFTKHMKQKFVRQLEVHHELEQLAKARVQRANDWQKKSVKRKVFCVWRQNASLRARFHRFHAKAHRRLRQQCFDFWHCFSMHSANMRQKQIALAAVQSKSSLRRSFRVWMDVYRVNVWTWSHRQRQQVLSLMHHFTVWRAFASSRAQRKSQVVCFQMQVQVKFVRNIFTVWFSLNLRKRCYHRLVKLFRKKATRRWLRNAFKELVVVTKTTGFLRRRLQRKLQQTVWCWTKFCHKQRHSRVKHQVSDEFCVSRRLHSALKGWRTNCHSAKWKREAVYKALSYRFCTLLKKSLYTWYIVSRRQLRLRAFMDSKRQQRGLLTKRQSFKSWRTFTSSSSRLKLQVDDAMSFCVERQLVRHFCAWFAYFERRKQKKQRLWDATLGYNTSLYSKTFTRWRTFAQHVRQKRKLLQTAQSRRNRRMLEHVLTKWRSSTQRQKHIKQQKNQANAFFHEYLVYSTFYHWQNEALFRTVLREKWSLATARIQYSKLSRALSSWKQNSAANSRMRTEERAAVSHLRHRELQLGISRWRSFQLERLVAKQRNATASSNAQRLRVKSCFKAWTSYCASRKLLKTKLQSIFRSDNGSMLCDTFAAWKRFRSKQTLDQLAQEHQRGALLRKIWGLWRSHRAFVDKMKCNVLVTSQLLKSNQVKLFFYRWTRYLAHRKQSLERLSRSEQHYRSHQYKQAIQCFKLQHLQVLSIANATAQCKQRMAKTNFGAWKHIVRHKKTTRHKKRIADRFRRSSCLQICLRQWRLTTNRATEAKLERAGAFHRALCLSHAWEAWTCVVQWERSVCEFHKKLDGHVIAKSYRAWEFFIRSRRKSKQMRAIASVFANVRACGNLWRAWREFVALQRRKHQDHFRALSFYSTTVLQKWCFEAWIRFRSLQQIRAEKRLQSECLRDFAICRRVFNNWSSYLVARRNRADTKQAQLTKIRHHLWARSLTTWKEHIERSRRCKSDLRKAVLLHWQIRARKGIAALAQWRQRRHNCKRLVEQAKQTRAHRMTQRCFRDWRDHHLWKRKYKRFLKFFQDNQQEDYFTRWRSFCSQTKLTRDLKLKADTFKYSNCMQRTFQRWVTFSHLTRLGERATKHYYEKTTTQVFTHWRQKVRILKRMRKMFLFQESFCLENHFGAWKRFAKLKKHQMARFTRATEFMNSSRLAKCWCVWLRWILKQREEKETIQLAVGFRQRFFNIKCFSHWRMSAQWCKRKRVIGALAANYSKLKRLRFAFSGLVFIYARKKALQELQKSLEKQLLEKRLARVVGQLHLLRVGRQQRRIKTLSARTHFRNCHQRKYWDIIAQRWYSGVKSKKRKRGEAVKHSDRRVLRKSFQGLLLYGKQMQTLRLRVSRFRLRYFRSMADECFFRWKRVARLKSRLRVFVRSSRRRERRRILHHWYETASMLSRRRSLLSEFTERRQLRCIAQRFQHWESVITDSWIHKRLIERSCQQRSLAMKQDSLDAWKRLLIVRRAREEWRQRGMQRHKEWLRSILHQWSEQVSTARRRRRSGDL